MTQDNKNLGFLGFPMYDIDKNGRIYSRFSNKYLKPNHCGKYRQVTLYNGTKHKTFLLHRLVAEAFIPNPHNYNTIDHIDYDKNNNCVSNLRWLSKTSNSKRSWEDKNHDIQKKAIIQMDLHGNILNEYDSIQEAANGVKCDRSNISRACSQQRIRMGYKWQFK